MPLSEDLRRRRSLEVTYSVSNAAVFSATALTSAASIILIWNNQVLDPMRHGNIPGVSVRLFAALIGVAFFLSFRNSALTAWRSLCAAFAGPLSIAERTEADLRLQEADAFHSGRGRVQSSKAASERYLQTIEMLIPRASASGTLPLPLLRAAYGALETSRAFDCPAHRYQILSRIITPLAGFLRPYRLSTDLFVSTLENYLGAVLYGQALDGKALIQAAREAARGLLSNSYLRSRISRLIVEALQQLPPDRLATRVSLMLTGLRILTREDEHLPLLKEALENTLASLPDSKEKESIQIFIKNETAC